MKLACPQCRKPIAGDRIDLPSERATCNGCGVAYRLPELIEPTPVALVVREPAGLAAKKDFQGSVSRHDDRFVIVPSRNKGEKLRVGLTASMLMLAVFMEAFALSSHGKLSVFLLPFLMVSGTLSFLPYAVRARIELDPRRFHLRRALRSTQEEPTENISGFVKAFRTSSSGEHIKEQPWTLNLITLDARAIQLDLSLVSSDQADSLAALLNDALDELREKSQAASKKSLPAQPGTD